MNEAHTQALQVAAVIALCSLFGCSVSASEVEGERKAILERAPIGARVAEVAAAVKPLGFSCSKNDGQFMDESGKVRPAQEHLWCDRERSYWLVCGKRTQAIFVPLNDRVSELHVHIGLVCL